MTVAPDIVDLRRRVQIQIDRELDRQRATLDELGPDTAPLVDSIASLLRGGKRLRAAFCHATYLACGGTHDEAALRMATSLEFFQAAALLHDDVMDDSDVRRGAPTAHVSLAGQHRNRGWTGDSERFGLAGAILAGDLCLVWTDDAMARCGLPPDELARARACFDQMRTQLMGGQFLDVLDSVRGWGGMDDDERVAQARRVVRYKSAKYSVEQPVLIGADAAGVSASDRAALSRFGLELGEAFQLRDDVLGVFGDPAITGKPAGDDLREGKRTVLVALTLARLAPEQSGRLESALGRPDLRDDEIEYLRGLIVDCGGLAALEGMIEDGTRRARTALDATRGLSPAGRDQLVDLADLTTHRLT